MQVSSEEIANGRLSDANLVLALRTLRDVGYVEIENVYARSWVADLRAAYDDLLQQHIEARGGIEGINAKSFGKSHIGMHLPLIEPFADPQIVANPIAVQVMEHAIGEDFQCSFYHSNTSYPGSGYQTVHRDWGPVFGTELTVPSPITALVFNVPLCDFTEENGSTEVWPGTHLIVDTDPADSKDLDNRAKLLPSQRTNVPAGSIILRDMRMWHRGMPNNADHARAMLAIVYQRRWLAVDKLLDIPQATWDTWPERAQRIFRRNTIV